MGKIAQVLTQERTACHMCNWTEHRETNLPQSDRPEANLGLLLDESHQTIQIKHVDV